MAPHGGPVRASCGWPSRPSSGRCDMSVLAGPPGKNRRVPVPTLLLVVVACAALGLGARAVPGGNAPPPGSRDLDSRLTAVLVRAGFTGRIESTLETRLGRPIDAKR